jgi:2-haloacid dehalogenase
MEQPIAAYVFDLYGTLLDYGSLRARFEGLVPDPAAFVASWREKQLHYALASSAMQRFVDFDTLTAAAYEYAAERYALSSSDVAREAAREAWAALPAFSDVPRALAAIRARGHRTAVLSNGTVRSIERGVLAAGIAGAFDALLSVEAVRVYKPDARVYALATQHFEVSAQQIVFVSSNGWDATGAAEFGFSTIWCNRAGLPAERIGKAPHRVVSTLDALVDA